ncbi:hypothetical protein RF657_19375 [Yersinia rochesterensis]|uniref:hypothetical protein n=1 Tax=Yersinia rochesterensis TaxID=1604335 RepID=UPI0028530BD1|nr:hypothetical protein [Yersinia rochesterensis]MDR5020527.1 hypothetical protein [Yersinia rochesterensis]
MSKAYSQQLMDAFSQDCRKELSMSLSQAYLHSHLKAKEFGSFWFQAQSYLRWFYVDALLEKTSRQLGLDFNIGKNVAKNCKHIAIHSNNWLMTVHHLPGRGPLPKQAKYRASYAHKNYDFFEGENSFEAEYEEIGGHVYLLHDGSNQHLSLLNFTIPTPDNSTILYTESLRIASLHEVEVEDIESDIEEKIILLTEQQIRKQQS